MNNEELIEKGIELAIEHAERYPSMRAVDVYKLLYQACMGPAHAITNCVNTNTWLMQEWDSVDGNPEEELYEDLSLHYPVFRLNLRPAKAKNIEPSKISDSFFVLSNKFPKRLELLASVWESVSEKIKRGGLALPDSDEIDQFNDFITEKQYPAMHHSREYSETYRPAYRLVDEKIS